MSVLTGELADQLLPALRRLQHGDQLASFAFGLLAELEKVTPQAIGSTLSALEQRGYVARTTDPDDRRRVVTAITDAGRATLASREQVISEHMTRALREGFDADEQRQIAAVIPLLERLSDEL